MKSLLQKILRRESPITRIILTASLLTFAALPLQSCGLLKQNHGSDSAGFRSGSEFLADISSGPDRSKRDLFRAFAKAGIPMPDALVATLNGKVALNTGESEARAAIQAAAGTDNANATKGVLQSSVNEQFHSAGVPKAIPLAANSTHTISKSKRLALSDETVTNDVTVQDPSTNENSNTGGGDAGGDDQNNANQCQARVSCFASASATASAFACAFAEAWACVYASVPPFSRLCTWARSQACVASFVSVYSETYVEAFVNVCQGCQQGQDGQGGGNSEPTVTPAPETAR